MFRTVFNLSLAGLALMTVLPAFAQAGLHFCNKTNQAVYVAYDVETGAIAAAFGAGPASDAVHGWWKIEPGACATPISGPLEYGSTVGEETAYYYFAHSDATTWSGDHRLCVDSQAFTFSGAKATNCPDKDKRGFKWLDTDAKTDYTLDLTAN